MKSLIQNCSTSMTSVAAIAVAIIVAGVPITAAAEQWELRTAPETVPGTHEIEAGEIDKAIRISNVWLPHIARTKRVAVLTNLCVAHIHNKNFAAATDYCERAVEQPKAKVVTYNNRGVLKVLQRDFEGALRDFAKASRSGCSGECSNESMPRDKNQPRAVALRNLAKSEIHARSVREPGAEDLSARTD